MRILVVNGSPRGEDGASFKLAGAFLEGYARIREADVEVALVPDLGIDGRLGRAERPDRLDRPDRPDGHAHLEGAPGKPGSDDGMAAFTAMLLRADAVLWCFPLCDQGLPSTLQALMERLATALASGRLPAGGGRSALDGGGRLLASKRHVLISVSDLPAAGANFKAAKAQFDLMLGEGNHQAVFSAQGRLFSMPEMASRTSGRLALAGKAGEEFAEGRIGEQTLRGLEEPMVGEKAYLDLAFPFGLSEACGSAGRPDASGAPGPAGRHEEPEAPADSALRLVRQLAALYNKRAWRKTDIVLQLSFVDLGRNFQLVLGRDGARVLEDGLLRPTTVVETPLGVWRRIARGGTNLNQALMDHLFRVSGDIHTINRWDYLFGTAVDDRSLPKKPNLLFMLAPWIVIWIALRASPTTGAMVALALFGAFPLLFLLFRPLAFERISLLVCPILALLSLAGVEFHIIKGVSYLFLGVMWGATLLGRYPLPAYYMTGGFGREKALSNPLYIHIQKVVCVLWTVLQILMAIWTFAIPEIGSVLTAVGCASVGSFTGFFQGWYPRHRASAPIRQEADESAA